MKPKSTSKPLPRGRAKHPRPTQQRIDDDHPEADERYIIRGIVRHGLVPVRPKEAISLRVDADVLEWFKMQGEGYQTRMNAVLRAFRDAST